MVKEEEDTTATAVRLKPPKERISFAEAFFMNNIINHSMHWTRESRGILTVQRMGRKGKHQDRDTLASSKVKSIGHHFCCSRKKQTEERLFWMWF